MSDDVSAIINFEGIKKHIVKTSVGPISTPGLGNWNSLIPPIREPNFCDLKMFNI